MRCADFADAFDVEQEQRLAEWADDVGDAGESTDEADHHVASDDPSAVAGPDAIMVPAPPAPIRDGGPSGLDGDDAIAVPAAPVHHCYKEDIVSLREASAEGRLAVYDHGLTIAQLKPRLRASVATLFHPIVATLPRAHAMNPARLVDGGAEVMRAMGVTVERAAALASFYRDRVNEDPCKDIVHTWTTNCDTIQSVSALAELSGLSDSQVSKTCLRTACAGLVLERHDIRQMLSQVLQQAEVTGFGKS